MAGFVDLEFKPHPNWKDGIQARVNFPNGYGASVVRGAYSYGGPAGLYELAVITADGELVYDTPITDDVLGWLSEDSVTKALAEIEALPQREAVEQ
jgi:hypothetical protein